MLVDQTIRGNNQWGTGTNMALWARYLLNGDGNDSSGNGRHLTVTNALYSNDRVTNSYSGSFGNVIASNMYLTYNSSPAGAESTVFSCTMWMKPGVRTRIVGGGSGRAHITFGGDVTFTDYRYLTFEPYNSGLLYLTSPGRSDVHGYHTFTLDKWTMVGFIYHGGYSTNRANSASFIENGKISNSTGYDGTWNPFPLYNKLIIGRVSYDGTTTYIYTGGLQDIQLYNHELTASEVRAIYDNGFVENKLLSGSMI